MFNDRRKLLLSCAVFLLLMAGAFCWFLYKSSTDPLSIARNGGTILVYETEAPAAENMMESLATSVKARLDENGSAGIEVRVLNDRRIEIAVPRANKEHEAQIADIQYLLESIGNLDFRILANKNDDALALSRAADTFKEGSRAWMGLMMAVAERWPLCKDAPWRLDGIAFNDLDHLRAHLLKLDPQTTENELKQFIAENYQLSANARKNLLAMASVTPPPPKSEVGNDFIVQNEGGRRTEYA